MGYSYPRRWNVLYGNDVLSFLRNQTAAQPTRRMVRQSRGTRYRSSLRRDAHRISIGGVVVAIELSCRLSASRLPTVLPQRQTPHPERHRLPPAPFRKWLCSTSCGTVEFLERPFYRKFDTNIEISIFSCQHQQRISQHSVPSLRSSRFQSNEACRWCRAESV